MTDFFKNIWNLSKQTQSGLFHVPLRSLILICILVLNACTDSPIAKGTGSEGESFIYGTLLDSMENRTLPSGIIVLAKITETDTGESLQWIDTAHSDSQGQFQIKPPMNGSYLLQFQWKDSLYLQIHNLTWNDSSIELGALGLARIKQIHGSLIHYPCPYPTLWISGTSSKSEADSLGLFTINAVMPGRSTLYAMCNSEVRAWNLTISGQCSSPNLTNLDWLESSHQIIINSECTTMQK